jgi:hypothetical protein
MPELMDLHTIFLLPYEVAPHSGVFLFPDLLHFITATSAAEVI